MPVSSHDVLNWKQRLSRVMNYPGTQYTQKMLDKVCRPAMQDVARELELRGAKVEFSEVPPTEDERLNHTELLVRWARNRTLSIRSGRCATRCRASPTAPARQVALLPAGNLPDGRHRGNDLMDYSKEQVIGDILDQYEKHLNFLHIHREAPGTLTFPDM